MGCSLYGVTANLFIEDFENELLSTLLVTYCATDQCFTSTLTLYVKQLAVVIGTLLPNDL